eukprot:TRINITY_DN1835_c0_g1_i1.p3 TRINITY_DN1835_c0_g1~~TRINITY_DN1835_c0_g1_i1.p3  ORF type:complete len:275 (+),score=62.43 TRINITY_DN1835_c0_g1_i1:520-1344(+)
MALLKERKSKSLASSSDKTQPLRITELSSKSLPEAMSSFVYSVETFQNKLVTELSKLEDEVIKNCETYNAVKTDMDVVLSNSREKDQALTVEIELLQKRMQEIETEANAKVSSIEQQYEELINKMKEENTVEISALHEFNKKYIEELNATHLAETEEYEKKLAELIASREKLEDHAINIENVLNTVKYRLKEYYDSHVHLQSSWKEQVSDTEEILYTDFVLHQVNKWENDNKWLVERLAEFGKENERLNEALKGCVKVSSIELVENVLFVIIRK